MFSKAETIFLTVGFSMCGTAVVAGLIVLASQIGG